MAQDCIFCRIASGDMESDIVYQDDVVVAFRDIHPQAKVHILIIPRVHIERPSLVAQTDQMITGHMVWAAAEIARQEGLDAYRLVANDGASCSQSVWHLHFHLLGGQDLGWPPFPRRG